MRDEEEELPIDDNQPNIDENVNEQTNSSVNELNLESSTIDGNVSQGNNLGGKEDDSKNQSNKSENKLTANETSISGGVVQGSNAGRDIIQTTYNSTKETELSLIKESIAFSSTKEIDIEEFDIYLKQLREYNILLLADDEYNSDESFEIMHKFAISLNIRNEDIRSTSIAKYKPKNEEPTTIYSFIETSSSFKREETSNLLLGIDAIKRDNGFTNSLFQDAPLCKTLPSILKANNLFLICRIKHEALKPWMKIQATNPTLPVFPYLITCDKRQDQQTSPEAKEQISKLLKEIEEKTLEEQIIIKTLLFIGSFFPDLPIDDFISLVELWLFEQEITVYSSSDDSKGTEKTNKNSFESLWESKGDKYLRTCCLRPKVNDTRNKLIGFNNDINPTLIKEELGIAFSIFIRKKIKSITKLSLVFHWSDFVAQKSISLLLENFDDDESGIIGWIIYVFGKLNKIENKKDEIKDFLNNLLSLTDQPHILSQYESFDKNDAYSRLASLFGLMLGDSYLKNKIPVILDESIRDGSHKAVLILIKRLADAPDFDAVYWMKRLVDGGKDDIRNDIGSYLVRKLVKGNLSIEELQDWLPEKDRLFQKGSNANYVSLAVLFDYVNLTTFGFDEKLYHFEPSKFPLFIFDSEEIANEKLDLLIKYLLHDWREIILPSQQIEYIALIVATWGWILYVLPNIEESINTDNIDNPEIVKVCNETITNILLEKVVTFTNKEEPQEIIYWWKERQEGLEKYLQKEQDIDFKKYEAILNYKIFLSELEQSFLVKMFEKEDSEITEKP